MSKIVDDSFEVVIGEVIYISPTNNIIYNKNTISDQDDIRQEIRNAHLSSHIKAALLKCVLRNLHDQEELYSFIRAGLNNSFIDPNEYFKSFVERKYLINFLAVNND